MIYTYTAFYDGATIHTTNSSVPGRYLEGARYAAEGVPIQVALDRLRKPHVPPERRRDVGLCLPRRHQPDLEPHVR